MKKFREMSIEERKIYLESLGIPKDSLNIPTLTIEDANSIIEHVIGVASLPIGLVFGRINGEDRIIPLAIEEPSVVAAANKAFKLSDGFKAWANKSEMVSTIYINTNKSKELLETIIKLKDRIESLAKEKAKRMEKYGGGFRKMWFESLFNHRGEFIAFYFVIDVSNAMGANMLNSFAEEMAHELEFLLGEKAILKILSNLSIYRKAYAEATWSESLEQDLRKRNMSWEEGIERFLDVVSIAQTDVFRLTTFNKGIMNGISGVAMAFGQDWRAIEAGAHTYSLIQRKPLANYWLEGNKLKGKIEVPLAVGTVGGAIKSLPHAQASFQISKVKTAQELSSLMAAVGLANNFSANYHLAIEGIQQGHMKLHARNVAFSVGARGKLVEKIAKKMIEDKNISYEYAQKLLDEFVE